MISRLGGSLVREKWEWENGNFPMFFPNSHCEKGHQRAENEWLGGGNGKMGISLCFSQIPIGEKGIKRVAKEWQTKGLGS